MYERKKRDSVRAGSASYVSRRHFSTICQSPPLPLLLPPPFFFSPLVVLSGFNLHSVTPRAPSLADCLRWAQFVVGEKWASETRNAPLPLSSRRESRQLGCERQSADEWNVEANAIFPHTAYIKEIREFRRGDSLCISAARRIFLSFNKWRVQSNKCHMTYC